MLVRDKQGHAFSALVAAGFGLLAALYDLVDLLVQVWHQKPAYRFPMIVISLSDTIVVGR